MSLAKALQNVTNTQKTKKTKQVTEEKDPEESIENVLTAPNPLEKQSNSLPSNFGLSGFNIMEQKLNNLKSERELRHTMMKLHELENEHKKSIKFITQLKKQKEDLITEREINENQIKTLQERNKLLQVMYDSDTCKHKQEIDAVKKQLNESKHTITQKNNELNAVNDFQKSMQLMQHIYQDNDKNTDHKYNVNSDNHESMQQNNASNLQIDKLLSELIELRNLKTEKVSLQNEINKLNEMAQSDLMKMSEEIIDLKAKTNTLQREKDEVMLLLEEAKVRSIYKNMNSSFDDLPHFMHKLSYCSDQSSASQNVNVVDYDEKNDFSEYAEYENAKLQSPLSLNPKKERKIADVTKEYLHLTASVVKMKFANKVQHITSADLIERVQSFHFCHYHDMMVTIMRNEEKKMKQQKQKQKQHADKLGKNDKNQKKGIFNKFKNRFRS